MFQGLTGWHAVIVLAIILLLFGAPKLPALAKSLGQSMKIFKSEIKNPEDDKATPEGGTGGTTPADEQASDTPSQPKP